MYCAIALVLYGMFVSSVIFDVPLNRFGRWCRDKCCAYQLRAVTFAVGARDLSGGHALLCMAKVGGVICCFGRWCRDKCCAYQLRAVTFVVGV